MVGAIRRGAKHKAFSVFPNWRTWSTLNCCVRLPFGMWICDFIRFPVTVEAFSVCICSPLLPQHHNIHCTLFCSVTCCFAMRGGYVRSQNNHIQIMHAIGGRETVRKEKGAERKHRVGKIRAQEPVIYVKS